MALQEGKNESENNKSNQVLAALESLSYKFSSKLDLVVMVTLQDVKQEMKGYNEPMSRTEGHIATAEDEVANLQAKNKSMKDKLRLGNKVSLE